MHGSHELKKRPDKIYDRLAADLPINSMVVPVLVDDPMPLPGTIGEKLKVLRSVRDDPLAGMHARGIIHDAELAAGRRWQRYHEQSEIGGARAIDPTREAVDGGRMRDPLSEQQMAASDAIKAADNALGWDGSVLIRAILGERLTVQQYAMRLGLCSEREFNHIGWHFRKSLDTLARLWGMRT